MQINTFHGQNTVNVIQIKRTSKNTLIPYTGKTNRALDLEHDQLKRHQCPFFNSEFGPRQKSLIGTTIQSPRTIKLKTDQHDRDSTSTNPDT